MIVLAAGGAYARRRQLEATRGASTRTSPRSTRSSPPRTRRIAAGRARAWRPPPARRTRPSAAGAEPEELMLVQIIDRPGTDDDKAVFRVTPAAARSG